MAKAKTTARKARAKKATAADKKTAALEKARATRAKNLEAKRAKQAKAKEAEQAKHTAALRELDPIAKEINTRFDKIAQIEGKADDHRLAAALRLAEAQKKCKAAGITFKKWVQENLHYKVGDTERKLSYGEAGRLATIGASPDPAKALEDLRAGVRKRVAKSAAKQKAALANAKQIAAPAAPKVSKLAQAETALAQLGDQGVVNLLTDQAAKHGMAVVSKTIAEKLTDKFAKQDSEPNIREMFLAMLPGAKMVFLEWAAGQVGAVLTIPDALAADKGTGDPLAIPEAFKRAKAAPAKTTRSRSKKNGTAQASA